jgi:uncharacterized membrane protein YoaK (UPF0700 family)
MRKAVPNRLASRFTHFAYSLFLAFRTGTLLILRFTPESPSVSFVGHPVVFIMVQQ